MELEESVTALAALAHESRLAVFRLLVEAGPDGLPAGAIADRLGIASTTLSFHLSQLSHAGLAMSRRDGRSIIYSANFVTMQDLMGFLTDNCCQGNACAFPDAVAGQPRRPQRRPPQ